MSLKSIVLTVTVVMQVVAIIFFFINVVTAVYLYAFHLLGWVVIFILLIKERIKEKREEDDNDYRNY